MLSWSVLHAQAELELRVASYIVVNRSARLLSCKNEVHSEASADLRNAYELAHELRLLALELRKLVDYYKQMRHGHRRLVVLEESRVGVYIVHSVFAENPLAAEVFALYRDHGTANLVAGEVGYLSEHMREIAEQVCHSAALKVDYKEADVVRAVADGERENIGLQRFALSGAGRSGDPRPCGPWYFS